VTALALCFALSGMGSLVLEVAWTRMLRLVFGSTTLAASTVLVAYMAGLGVGAWLGGRVARRLRNGVRAYGVLELAIAAWALVVPLALELFPALARELLYTLPFWQAAAVRFALSLALLAPATLCMGATLPILVEAAADDPERAGPAIARLYGWNTLGAVAGVFAATFGLFPAIGLRATNLAGAGLDVAAGVVALVWLGRRAPARAPSAAAPRALAGSRLALAAYAVVGASALVCEVAWTRLLAMVLGSSIYAFAAMLGSFLLGIGLGSLLARPLLARVTRPERVYALSIAAFGLLSLGSFAVIPTLPGLFTAAVRGMGTSGLALTSLQVGLSLAAMLPPTLILGALFPLLARALAAHGAGAAVGAVYFANTVGSATGAFAAGFWLIPTLGLQRTLALAAALPLASAAVLLARAPGRLWPRAATAIALASLAALLLARPPAFAMQDLLTGAFNPHQVSDERLPGTLFDGVQDEEVVFARDGLEASVAVTRMRGLHTLYLNGKPDASSGLDMPTQVLLGHLGLLFGPPARRALVIGWASGVTIGSAARHPLERIDAVELEPATLAASRFFSDHNGRPESDPRVRLVVDDGRTRLAYGLERYDLIVSEPSNPWFTGVANLFTQEFFAAARRSLAPRGRLLQWIQLYSIDPATLSSILAAMRAEFPYLYAFVVSREMADLMVLAAQEPLTPADLPDYAALPALVRSDLERVGIFSRGDLWSLLRVLPPELDALAAQAPQTNRDDNLFVELRSPRLLYAVDPSAVFAMLEQAGRGVAALFDGAPGASDPELLGELALAYARGRGAFGLARTLVERADALGSSAYADAARVELAIRDAGPAVEDPLALLERAVERAPGAREVRGVRSEARGRAGDLEGALADVDALLAERPDGLLRLQRLNLLLRLGRFEAAAPEADLYLATELGGREQAGWFAAAQAYLEVGRVEDAVHWLERYVEGQPGWHRAWELLARAYERVGRAQDAARARRNQGRNLWLLGRKQAELGDFANALALVERGVALDPEFAPAAETLRELRAKANP
jgi:spermidine synthase